MFGNCFDELRRSPTVRVIVNAQESKFPLLGGDLPLTLQANSISGKAVMHATLLLTLLALPLAGQAVECATLDTRTARPVQATVLAPLSPELSAPSYRLGSGAVLSRAYDEAQSAEQVVLRLEIEKCQNVAIATPAAGAVSANDPAAYVKQTEFDNTPYRFNMTQGGKRMTADDFDAWIKANGYTVGSRRADPNAPAAPAAAETAPPGEAPPVE